MAINLTRDNVSFAGVCGAGNGAMSLLGAGFNQPCGKVVQNINIGGSFNAYPVNFPHDSSLSNVFVDLSKFLLDYIIKY